MFAVQMVVFISLFDTPGSNDAYVVVFKYLIFIKSRVCIFEVKIGETLMKTITSY